MNSKFAARSVLLAAAILAFGVVALSAQELPASTLGQQSLRPYWHVFAAYAIVVVLIGGWALSIARRLRSLEERLSD